MATSRINEHPAQVEPIPSHALCSPPTLFFSAGKHPTGERICRIALTHRKRATRASAFQKKKKVQVRARAERTGEEGKRAFENGATYYDWQTSVSAAAISNPTIDISPAGWDFTEVPHVTSSFGTNVRDGGRRKGPRRDGSNRRTDDKRARCRGHARDVARRYHRESRIFIVFFFFYRVDSSRREIRFAVSGAYRALRRAGVSHDRSRNRIPAAITDPREI